MRVILCGYNWTGCKALDLLLSAGHEVYVFTHDNPFHVSSLAGLCEKLGVAFSTEKIVTSNMPFRPDVVCSVYYRYIIGKGVIEASGGRIFNLHPSLLPAYRGCSSVTWAMINGETRTGFTYHYIDEGCDTGRIILQKPVAIEPWDTQLTLYNRLMFEGMKYFDEALGLVVEGVPGTPQTGESSSYPRGCPYGGVIDPTWGDEAVERFIRAMIFPPYPPAVYGGEEVYSMSDYYRAAGRDTVND